MNQYRPKASIRLATLLVAYRLDYDSLRGCERVTKTRDEITVACERFDDHMIALRVFVTLRDSHKAGTHLLSAIHSAETLEQGMLVKGAIRDFGRCFNLVPYYAYTALHKQTFSSFK